jgi:hypothetical protein
MIPEADIWRGAVLMVRSYGGGEMRTSGEKGLLQ